MSWGEAIQHGKSSAERERKDNTASPRHTDRRKPNVAAPSPAAPTPIAPQCATSLQSLPNFLHSSRTEPGQPSRPKSVSEEARDGQSPSRLRNRWVARSSGGTSETLRGGCGMTDAVHGSRAAHRKPPHGGRQTRGDRLEAPQGARANSRVAAAEPEASGDDTGQSGSDGSGLGGPGPARKDDREGKGAGETGRTETRGSAPRKSQRGETPGSGSRLALPNYRNDRRGVGAGRRAASCPAPFSWC